MQEKESFMSPGIDREIFPLGHSFATLGEPRDAKVNLRIDLSIHP